MAVILLLCVVVIIGYAIVKYSFGKKTKNTGREYPVPENNFPVYIGGKDKEKYLVSTGLYRISADEYPENIEPGTYYISRSCAVETIVLTRKNNTWHVLANKRGPGCFNNVGLWNVPSGYVDYNETCEQTGVRETFEETGVHISSEELNFYCIDSVPEGRQNIVIVYYTVIDPERTDTSRNYCEKDEVDEILWIPEENLDKVRWISYDHIQRVKNVIKMLKDTRRVKEAANVLGKTDSE